MSRPAQACLGSGGRGERAGKPPRSPRLCAPSLRAMPEESRVRPKVPVPSFRRKPESRFVGHELGPGLRRDDDVRTKSCFGITMSDHRCVHAILPHRTLVK